MRRLVNMVAMLGIFILITSQVHANGSGKAEEPFVAKTEVTGSITGMYNYNFNRPRATADGNGNGVPESRVNLLRAFDTDPNSFSFNMAEVSVQNQVVDWAKVRVDLDFGRDTRIYQAFGYNDGDNFELQQAFAHLTADVGNGLGFKIGKFVTLNGAEVIEAGDNNNASRGLLFTWAIPFTHTGVLMDYAFNDNWGITLGVLNGWDNVLDNNSMKTGIGMITLNAIPDKLSFWLVTTAGPEQDNSDGNHRYLIDSGLTWNATEDLAVVLNFDLGKEEGIGGRGFANWWGAAGYTHWRASDLFGLTLRAELFNQDQAAGVDVRTVNSLTGAVLGADDMWEGTLTSHLYLFDGFDLRFEYRHDQADNPIFLKHNGTFKEGQDTLISQVVYSF